MLRTLTATFDGQTLRPDNPLDLEPNRRYLIVVQELLATAAEAHGDAWDVLEAIAGTVDAPNDWSAEHDHYLYGTPKRQPDREA